MISFILNRLPADTDAIRAGAVTDPLTQMYREAWTDARIWPVLTDKPGLFPVEHFVRGEAGVVYTNTERWYARKSLKLTRTINNDVVIWCTVPRSRPFSRFTTTSLWDHVDKSPYLLAVFREPRRDGAISGAIVGFVIKRRDARLVSPPNHPGVWQTQVQVSSAIVPPPRLFISGSTIGVV